MLPYTKKHQKKSPRTLKIAQSYHTGYNEYLMVYNLNLKNNSKVVKFLQFWPHCPASLWASKIYGEENSKNMQF